MQRADPAVIVQLLRGFVDAQWLDGLRLDEMERLNTRFHARSGHSRIGDMVWRIPRQDGGDSYLMLLMEFQSKPDIHMAVRMLVYAGLLLQDRIDQGALLPDGRLPPILPVVLYHG